MNENPGTWIELVPKVIASPWWIISSFLFLCTWMFWNSWVRSSAHLDQYPGPFLAKYTNLWRLYQTYCGDMARVYQRLHSQYGPIVRVGPNVVDVDMPELVKPALMDIKGDWRKTEFYHGSSALVSGKIVYNLFSQTDSKKHAKEKRPVAKYYSALGIASLEPHMDSMITKLCESLEARFVEGEKTFGLGTWLLYYSWDVVGSVTFSQPIGYMERGQDFDGTLANADMAIDYFSLVGMIPALDHWLDKNPIMHIGPPGFNTITSISLKHLVDRYQGNDSHYHDSEKPDFLDRFIEAKNNDPKDVDDAQIISWLMINMIAGADTTALTMKSAFYYCLRNESIMARLRREALAAGINGADPVSYKDARAIPYVEAVVREALRILPGVSMPLERYVPAGGHQLSNGDLLPAGSIVGINPYILCRNKEIFGEDAEEFRPERWLRDEACGETEEAFQARLTAMNNADLTFGGGRRVCIGKHLGLYQVYKVLLTLVVRYDIQLVEPTKEWKVINSWFPRQLGGLDVKIRKRA